MKKIFFAITFSFFGFIVKAQNEANSPYSLFGLGSQYETNYGSIPALGGSGIAIPSKRFINNLNPASLSFIDKNSFLFDLGGKSSSTSYTNQTTQEVKNNFYFSHLGFAFPVTSRSGASFGLRPFTNAAYQITNLELPVQGSNETYFISVIGKGGLNSFDFSYGYKILNNLSLGFSGSVIFGTIEEARTLNIAASTTTIEVDKRYKGFRPAFGAQFKIDSTLTIGATLKFPTVLGGNQVRSIATLNTAGTTEVESEEESDVDDFKLPTEIALGVSKSFQNLNINLDYERKIWDDVSMPSSFGDYTNQDKVSFGVTYSKIKKKLSYFDKMTYNAGLSYDSGYLKVNGEKVQNASVNIGLGFPLEHLSSFVNVSYSYGQRGKVSESLIKENYHLITLNLSLEGLWFVKRKYE